MTHVKTRGHERDRGDTDWAILVKNNKQKQNTKQNTLISQELQITKKETCDKCSKIRTRIQKYHEN